MAKKPLTPEEQNVEETNKAEYFYDKMIGVLGGLRPAAYPVVFCGDEDDDPVKLRYKRFNADEKNETGVFVRMLDIHLKDEFNALCRKMDRWNAPESILWLVTHAACTFDGTPFFDHNNTQHLSLLVTESEFTRLIFEEAMYVNCYWERPEKDIAKNSNGTEKQPSE